MQNNAPKSEWEPIPSTLGVKFSNAIFILKSALDQWGVSYTDEDLEDSPFGKGVRIKKSESQDGSKQ